MKYEELNPGKKKAGKKKKNGDSTKTINNNHIFELCHQIKVMRIFVVSFRTDVHDTVKAVLLKTKTKTISNYRVRVAQRDLVSSSTSAGRLRTCCVLTT